MKKGRRVIRQKFDTAQGRSFQVTVLRITGGEPGPTLTLIAGQHGMEHIGPVMLTRLADEISPDDIRGTLNICPCANPLALELDYEFYPENEDLNLLDDYFYSQARHSYCVFKLGRHDGADTLYNMNRLWLREGDHGAAGRVTAWLWKEICREASLVIDFHCLQAEKPLIFNNAPKATALAALFGVEAIYDNPPPTLEYRMHGLHYRANLEPGRYGYCVEFSRQHELRTRDIEIGRAGVINTMKGIGMMDGEVISPGPVYLLDPLGHPLATEKTGHLHYLVEEYEPVSEGQEIFQVRDIQTLEIIDRGRAPCDGVLGMRSFRPVSRPGEKACVVRKARKLVEPGQRLEKILLPAREPGNR